MKIAIIGAGAMGARFGYMLQRAGQTVTFIDGWLEHINSINQHGLVVIEKGKMLNFKIPAYLPTEIKSDDFDLLLFFTKAMQLKPMLEAIKPLISSNTHALILSNGLGNIDVIAEYIVKEKIIAGVTVWSSELLGPGKIETTGSGSIELQQVGDADNHFLNQLVNTLDEAGLFPIISANVLHAIWKKAAFNCILNTYCTLVQSNVSQFGATSAVDHLVDAALNEIIQVAHAEQINLAYQEVKAIIYKQFDPTTSGDHYPSMYQDIHKKRKTEIDYLNGAIVKFGQKHHIATPINNLLTQLIHTIEEVIGAQ